MVTESVTAVDQLASDIPQADATEPLHTRQVIPANIQSAVDDGDIVLFTQSG